MPRRTPQIDPRAKPALNGAQESQDPLSHQPHPSHRGPGPSPGVPGGGIRVTLGQIVTETFRSAWGKLYGLMAQAPYTGLDAYRMGKCGKVLTGEITEYLQAEYTVFARLGKPRDDGQEGLMIPADDKAALEQLNTEMAALKAREIDTGLDAPLPFPSKGQFTPDEIICLVDECGLVKPPQ